MKTYFGSDQIKEFPPATVIALGNFDGVHIGHQAILGRAREHADRLGVPLVCFTFQPHPTIELKPQADLKLLMTYEEKRGILENTKVDLCVEERFTPDFAKTTARDFFFHILIGRLRARVIVVGENFSFGRNREGNIARLREFCAETSTLLEAMEPVHLEGAPVSSSRIRSELADGNVSAAARMLGRPFFYRAEVIPTANMLCAEKFPLRAGVYATSVLWRDREYPAVTNIGIRPTFDSQVLRIETHLLGQSLDLYGEILEVRFHERIRDERKFESVPALVAQIASDAKLAESHAVHRNS
jgi:riboflavin kinase/FMN adenylyltransferase